MTGFSLPARFCAAGVLLALSTLASSGAAQAQQAVIYDDHLANGWASYSWAAVKLDDTALVHAGKDAISVTVAAGSYGALELRIGAFDASKYKALTFWINGGPTGGQNSLAVKASVDNKQQGGVPIPKLAANAWTKIVVPFAGLGIAATPNVTGFLIQNTDANAAPTFYVDDIQMTAEKLASSTPPEPPAPTFNVHQGLVRPLAFTGVNISGGEFGDTKPGVTRIYGTNYTYPSASELDYFAGKGVNIVRFPFHWADLQPALNGPLNADVLKRIKGVVSDATGRGVVVLLDPHDYARYYDKVVGSADVPDAAFADFWGKVAAQFKDNPRVWLGLMNEPHDLPKEQWAGAANAAIAGIRAAGAKNLILVPGISWTGAHSWVASGNAEAMLGIKDSQNHYIIEAHQYLDSDSSGTHPAVVSTTIGSERLAQFTAWCRAHHQQAFLSEFGAAASEPAARAMDDMLSFMEANRDVWVGFTWWSAGAWFGDYMFTVEPKNGQDRPQMSFLRPHLQKAPVGTKAAEGGGGHT